MTIVPRSSVWRPLTVVAITSLVLGACASTPHHTDASATQVDPGIAKQYRSHVNRLARIQGADVVWVNPPDDEDLAKYADEDS